MSNPLRLCSRAPRTEMWVRLIGYGCSANVRLGQEARARIAGLCAMWERARRMQCGGPGRLANIAAPLREKSLEKRNIYTTRALDRAMNTDTLASGQ